MQLKMVVEHPSHRIFSYWLLQGQGWLGERHGQYPDLVPREQGCLVLATERTATHLLKGISCRWHIVGSLDAL